MPTPLWFQCVAIFWGLLIFVFPCVLAVPRIRSATNRDDRLEAVGAIVPGLGGLLVIVAVLVPWRALGLALAALALPVMVLGRALYELVLLRRRGGS